MAGSVTSIQGVDLLRKVVLESQVRCRHEGLVFSRLYDCRLAEGMLQVGRDGRSELHIHLSDASVSCSGQDVIVMYNDGKQALTMSFAGTEEAYSWASAMQNAINAWDSHNFPLEWPTQQLTELAQLRKELTRLKQKCDENDQRCRQSGDVATNGMSAARAEQLEALMSEVAQRDQRIAKLEDEARTYKDENAVLASLCDNRLEDIKSLQDEVNKLRAYLAARETNSSQKATECGDLKREIDGHAREKSQLAKELEEERRKNQVYAERLKEVLARVTEADSLNKRVKDELTSELEQERQRHNAFEAARHQELLEMTAARDALQEQVEALKIAKNKAKGVETLKLEMNKLDSSNFKVDEASDSTTSAETPRRNSQDVVSAALPDSVVIRTSQAVTSSAEASPIVQPRTLIGGRTLQTQLLSAKNNVARSLPNSLQMPVAQPKTAEASPIVQPRSLIAHRKREPFQSQLLSAYRTLKSNEAQSLPGSALAPTQASQLQQSRQVGVAQVLGSLTVGVGGDGQGDTSSTSPQLGVLQTFSALASPQASPLQQSRQVSVTQSPHLSVQQRVSVVEERCAPATSIGGSFMPVQRRVNASGGTFSAARPGIQVR